LDFHHIGLIVDNLDKGKNYLESLVSNLVWSDIYNDLNIGVTVMFGTSTEGMRYELIVPLGTDSPISNHLATKGNMLHHIAYIVENFEEKRTELRTLKFIPLGEPKSAVAFNGKKVAFFLTPIRTIIEIVEK